MPRSTFTRTLQGAEELAAAPMGELMLHRLRYEAAAAAFEPVDALDQVDGEGDGHSFGGGHGGPV